MTTMATTATTTATIVEVTGRQEEDNDAEIAPSSRSGERLSPLLVIYTAH